MKKLLFYIFPVFLLLGTGCSTTKNTTMTRAYHGMKVVHNVQFNGLIAFNDGMAAIHKANEDDYSTILNLYPISNEKAQQAATSDMDKCIEKCRKCIKLHSIHVKPESDPRRLSDPEYRNWLKNKEFNPEMHRAWLLLAQAEFHKGDFLGSIGTFNYVSRLYQNDPDMVAQCQLWVARAYAELGWQYEAEEMLAKVKVDNLKRAHQPFYSAVSADILLKGKHYREAIPMIKVAKRDEDRRLNRPRFEFVLGQLYQRQGQNEAAAAAFKRVLQLQPPHEMEFQARVRYYELQGDTLQTMRQLKRMARREKNKDVLDILYGTMGNLYLANGDTAQALRCYEQGLEKSTKNGTDKARIAVTAGDLYFDRCAYEQAALCYEQAVQTLSHEHEAYERVLHRSEVLGGLVTNIQTVRLQDSLQYLSTLTEAEQRAIVDQVIADLRAKEQADSIRSAQSERDQTLYGERKSVDMDMMPGMSRDNSWYFYNEDLLRKGKQQFRQQWGDRTLEDNWRRRSKAMSVPIVETVQNDSLPDLLSTTDGAVSGGTTPVTDIYQPEYYLQQIPKTAEEMQSSNRQIADALYALIGIYRDRLDDRQAAMTTMEDFERRFGDDERLLELYYRGYLAALKGNDEASAQYCKQQLVSRFPDSEQARIVSVPDYLESLRRMAQEQDTVYEQTYDAYRQGQYAVVKDKTRYAREHFAASPLMPRFLFLNAVALARTDGQEAFRTALKELVEHYPSHELGAMAKSMLAMMNEGQQSQPGDNPSSLQEQRTVAQTEPEETEEETQTEPENALLLRIAHNENALHELLYEVALFNFSQFLIKDFDLQTYPDYSRTESALKISGFDSPDEVAWYRDILLSDPAIQTKFEQMGVTHTQL